MALGLRWMMRGMLVRALGLALLLGDALFVGAHLAASHLGAGHLDAAWLLVHRWRLDADGGVAEGFQYLKYLALAVVAWRLRGQLGLRSARPLALFSLLLLLDDATGLHERLGAALAGRQASIAGLTSPAQAAGELLGFSVLGAAFAWFLVSALGSRRSQERRLGARVAGLVALLALFGAVIDVAGGGVVGVAAAGLAGAVGWQLPGALVASQPLEPAASLPLPLRVAAVLPFPLGAAGLPFPLAAAALPFPLGLARLGSAVLASGPVASALLELRLTKVVTTVVEEGGEMVCVSLLLVYLVRVLATRRPAPGSPQAEVVVPADERVGR